MNYLTFNLLAQADKIKAVWKNGILIAERDDNCYHYELYQLNNFYVEKQANLSGHISHISKTFRSVCYLDPYLDNIDIASIYEI